MRGYLGGARTWKAVRAISKKMYLKMDVNILTWRSTPSSRNWIFMRKHNEKTCEPHGGHMVNWHYIHVIYLSKILQNADKQITMIWSTCKSQQSANLGSLPPACTGRGLGAMTKQSTLSTPKIQKVETQNNYRCQFALQIFFFLPKIQDKLHLSIPLTPRSYQPIAVICYPVLRLSRSTSNHLLGRLDRNITGRDPMHFSRGGTVLTRTAPGVCPARYCGMADTWECSVS